MLDKPASMPLADFEVLVRRAGLPLTAAQMATIHGVYGHLETMAERVRGPVGAPRPRSAEPSHIFVPGQGWGPR